MKKKLYSLLTLFFFVSSLAYASQIVTIDVFRGLSTNPKSDKQKDGSHTKFTNAYISDGNVNVVKGRDRLSSSAHADTVVNMMCYYESSSGTKKIVVKESDEVVTYDTDGTNRTQIASTLTNEATDCVQEGNSLYWNSSTDGLYKWTGSGSAAAVGSVSAPSTVDFGSTTGDGGMTAGNDAIVIPKQTALTNYWKGSSSTGSCVRDFAQISPFVDGDSCDQVDCTNTNTDPGSHGSGTCFDTTNFTKNCATSTTYKYVVTKNSSIWGIESEASSSDDATLLGNNIVTVSGTNTFIGWSDSSCTSGNQHTYAVDVITEYTGKKTRTTGTLASAPSAPFDGYCIYRTVAGGTDYFKLGCVTGGGTAYMDGKPDVVLGDPLDTTIDTIAPPAARYIETYKGTLFAAQGNTISFTRLPLAAATNADTYWLATDKILLSADNNITGMQKTSNALLIFTNKNTYELTGFGAQSFRLKVIAQGVGAVSDETIEVDTNGDVFAFNGTLGLYKIRTFEQPQDDLSGSVIDQDRVKIIRVSSPDIDDVFLGTDGSISLDPANYPASHAYYDSDNDLYFLYIGQDCFIFDNANQAWSYLPGTKMIASVYRKSANATGQGVLVDNLGYFFNNWKGYENGIESGTVTGAPTASTASTLTDSTATFNTTNDGLKGLWVILDNGTSIQYRQISSNTGTALTVSSNWTVNPTTADTYYVAYIMFNAKTKQYTFQKPPKLTQLQALTIVNNLAATTQNLRIWVYTDKSTTPISFSSSTAYATVDLSASKINKLGFGHLGSWAEFEMRSFVYNTSNSIVSPIDIINYSAQLVPKEDL